MSKITKYFICGERCSGTNFLDNAILTNFNLELRTDLGSKHFFCFNNYNNSHDDTLFIGIIRNPIYWINSFSTELFHVPNHNKSINNFLFNEFYSINENDSNKIILQDFNWQTLTKYKNIFELRKMKNFYLLNVMKTKVKNYILINYESLLFHYDFTLDFIKNKFNLISKYSIYKPINKYKKSDNYNFVKQRNILLEPNIINIIWDNLHVQQENRLGYFKDDNNNYLKNKDNIKFFT
jgi:hypothetical protein